MILYTGWVTAVCLVGAAFSLWFLQELPSIFESISPSSTTLLRWIFAVIFSAVFFFVGWRTNRKKVMRAGPNGKPVEGSPNTIFFVPLQYWAFAFMLTAGCAITVWGIDGR